MSLPVAGDITGRGTMLTVPTAVHPHHGLCGAEGADIHRRLGHFNYFLFYPFPKMILLSTVRQCSGIRCPSRASPTTSIHCAITFFCCSSHKSWPLLSNRWGGCIHRHQLLLHLSGTTVSGWLASTLSVWIPKSHRSSAGSAWSCHFQSVLFTDVSAQAAAATFQARLA